MVPAGDPTQSTVDKLGELLDEGDTIVDGGNSRWTDDKLRQEQLRPSGIHYVDVGTSGGVWGISVGYCMMVGGDDEAVERLSPILDVLAPPSTEEHGPGWGHFGPTGAGHYVKMVHNGVEYGMMQAYAEGFSLFDGCEYELDNAKIAHLWMQGSVVRSWLCELAARAFEQEGNELANIAPYVEDSGEGRWTIEDAIDRRIPTPVITASLYERFSSRGQNAFAAKVNAALRNQFGGHAVVAADAAAQTAAARGVGGGGHRGEPARRGTGAPAGPSDHARDLRRRPGTWLSASSCRRSTTSRTRARFRRAST